VIRAHNLEYAVKLRERLRQLLVFKKGTEGEDGWKGLVQCGFGTYLVELDMNDAEVRFAVMTAVLLQEDDLREELDALGVEFND